MKPAETTLDPQGDLFRIELDRIVDSSHPLVRLGKEVDWNRLVGVFGETYCEENGRPAASTRKRCHPFYKLIWLADLLKCPLHVVVWSCRTP
jgi:hypothetical protein